MVTDDKNRFFDIEDQCVRLRIRLTPNAREESIGGLQKDAGGKSWLKASVRAVPEKGKANKALISLLAKELGIAKSGIEITNGHVNRNKTLLVPILPEAIERLEKL